jgi:hypothetical protein
VCELLGRACALAEERDDGGADVVCDCTKLVRLADDEDVVELVIRVMVDDC